MNQLSLRNNQLNFNTSGDLPIILVEDFKNIPKTNKETKKCQHVIGQTWKT